MKKYDEVITAKAKTSQGVFTVHRIEDKVYFEIPASAYGKLMLWSAEVAKAPPNVGWGGKAGGRNFLRWERRGSKILLWQVAFEKRAEGKAIQDAVESANLATIIFSFAIETENKDKEAVINATPLFTTDIGELSIKKAVPGSGTIDESRSYLEEIKNFPTNIETRVLLTFRGGAGGGLAGADGPIPKKGGGGGGGKSISVLAHYSLTLLPEKPMMGRYFDPRVGFFTQAFEDYASDKTWMVKRQYIARFRLEKRWRPILCRRRPDQADRLLSEPRNPREMAPLYEARRRNVEARLREGRLQQRHRLQVRAHQRGRPDVGRRRRPLLGDPLGRRSDAKRNGGACPRSALGRDRLGPHHFLARHHQARPAMVLRPVRRLSILAQPMEIAVYAGNGGDRRVACWHVFLGTKWAIPRWASTQPPHPARFRLYGKASTKR